MRIKELENEYECQLHQLEKAVSPMRFAAFQEFLHRTIAKLESELTIKHNNKLCSIYGSTICQKETRDSCINLSDCTISDDVKNIFSLGMNCHLKSKYNHIKQKIEIEKLYDSIEEKCKNKELIIKDEEVLKCELKRFGFRKVNHHATNDILTKDDYAKIKEFRNNDNIIIRKADKSNIFVIMNSKDYDSKLKAVLDDSKKFKLIAKDPTEKLKKKINTLITSINAKIDSIKLQKQVGHFTPGYIYCNPKIHKSRTDPPMRPIISQIGTGTYTISKALNSIILPYLHTKYMIRSKAEFVELSRTVKSPKFLASLDVENLFTNVPVGETIDIILNNCYSHDKLPPPDIPRNTLQQLLEICTTETPFRTADGKIYQQIDGVSMGSSLGNTFANLYMAYLENNFLSNLPGIDSAYIVVSLTTYF